MTEHDDDKQGPKKTLSDKMTRAIAEIDIDQLRQLLMNSTGPRKSLWAIDNLLQHNLDGFIGIGSAMLETGRDPRKNHALHHQLMMELLLRAELTSLMRYTRVVDRLPVDKFASAHKEVQETLGGEVVSFSKDYGKARFLFCQYHEIYRKFLNTFASLAAVIAKDSRWQKRLTSSYLETALEGRYSSLVPDKRERFIRNAFSHVDCIRSKEGKFILEDKDGARRVFSASALDRELRFIVTRMIALNNAFWLASAVQLRTFEIMYELNKDEFQS